LEFVGWGALPVEQIKEGLLHTICNLLLHRKDLASDVNCAVYLLYHHMVSWNCVMALVVMIGRESLVLHEAVLQFSVEMARGSH